MTAQSELPPVGMRDKSFTVRVAHSSEFDKPDQRLKINPRDHNDVACALLLAVVAIYLVLVCAGPFFAPSCHLRPPEGKKWKNPEYDGSPCLDKRLTVLGGLTLRESSIVRNIYLSLVLGALIGYERRGPDKPAGIRSMSLTSLGCCCFTYSSCFAFQWGPMDWDSSRITADIVKGIGFFSGAVIWKGMVYSQVLSKEIQQAHGITTAAGNWLAAAVGCGCGGGMNAMATVTVALVCIMMRFGPRNSDLVLVQADLTTSVPEGAEIQAAEISLQPPSPPFAMKFLE